MNNSGKDPMRSMNLIKLMEQFADEDAARETLETLRWPKGVECLRCQSKEISRIYDRNLYECNSCRYQFSVTTDTVMHDTHLSLTKWFVAAYLMTESRKGISAMQLKRTLGVTYKTAWYLCHRIRSAMAETLPALLEGTIEVDETYVGRSEKRGRSKGPNKAAVVGAIERGGNVRLRVIPDASKATLHAFVKEVAADNTEFIFTDEWTGYLGIGDHNTEHKTVNHSIGEWVNGDVHTNTQENVWSLLKRSIIGSYHKVSVKHLDAYLQELEWRFNNRRNQWLFRDTLRKLVESEPIPYKRLIAIA